MEAKREISRFSIRFDISDPQHIKAINILNSAGRKKAERIAKALLFYERYGAGENLHSTEISSTGSTEFVAPVEIEPSVVVLSSPSPPPPKLVKTPSKLSNDLWDNIDESLGMFSG